MLGGAVLVIDSEVFDTETRSFPESKEEWSKSKRLSVQGQ